MEEQAVHKNLEIQDSVPAFAGIHVLMKNPAISSSLGS